MFMMNVLVLAVGFWALIKGADFFVDGSAALAKNFRIPGLVIGLTIVAAGTSAPELAVSTTAAFQGANEIALSNVVGSNIFNLPGSGREGGIEKRFFRFYYGDDTGIFGSWRGFGFFRTDFFYEYGGARGKDRQERRNTSDHIISHLSRMPSSA